MERHAWVVLPGLVFVLASCRAEPEEVGLDRQTFIDTYVELRVAALATPSLTIDVSTKNAILAERGLTEESLLDFADRHGSDPRYMTSVWSEVERRLEDLRGVPDDSAR